MEERGWLDYLVAVGTIATPIIVSLFGVMVWKYQQAIERRIRLEEQLRDDRIETYNLILEPFIILLMSDKAWASDPQHRKKDKFTVGTSKLLSLEYRRTSFRLSLIGSDSVVSSYNDLMQHFFQGPDTSSFSVNDHKEVVSLLGSFLLEIRKSMGNESTKIDKWGMLEWFIKDIRNVRDDRSNN